VCLISLSLIVDAPLLDGLSGVLAVSFPPEETTLLLRWQQPGLPPGRPILIIGLYTSPCCFDPQDSYRPPSEDRLVRFQGKILTTLPSSQNDWYRISFFLHNSALTSWVNLGLHFS